MKNILYKLSYSTKNLIGNGDQQTLCLSKREIIKSFSYGFPDDEIVLNFELHQKAKLTNCLSNGSISSGLGLLIDLKTRELFANFQLCTHKFYKTEIKGKKDNEIKNYFWLHLSENFTNDIDYTQSVFYETNGISRINELKIDSFSFYEKEKNDKGWRFDLEPKIIIFKNESKIKNLDMFRIPPFESGILISERLKEMIIEKKLTGFEIKEYNNIFF